MTTGCGWIDDLLDKCRKCHQDGEDCAPEDGSPCPYAPILHALPAASEEQREAALAALIGTVKRYPKPYSAHWLVTRYRPDTLEEE